MKELDPNDKSNFECCRDCYECPIQDCLNQKEKSGWHQQYNPHWNDELTRENKE